jgi:AcrR family transcriptional regulator
MNLLSTKIKTSTRPITKVKPLAAKKPAAKKTAVPVEVVSSASASSAAMNSSTEPRRRRGNRRSEQTVENILTATEQVILKSGADRISILEVCHAAEISRGTFYRYFASQDELLDAFSKHRRENFHKSLHDALSHITDPDERLATMFEYLDTYLKRGSSRRLLLVAPEFAMAFFKRMFHDAVIRFQDLLAPVFDVWDVRLNTNLDRELICELIVRFILSEHLAGNDSDRQAMPRRIGRLVDSLRFGGGLARR